jgi:hypothetical protein
MNFLNVGSFINLKMDETPNNIIKECDAPSSKGLKLQRKIVLSRLLQGMRNLSNFEADFCFHLHGFYHVNKLYNN